MNAKASHPPAHRKRRDERGTARCGNWFHYGVDRATCQGSSEVFYADAFGGVIGCFVTGVGETLGGGEH